MADQMADAASSERPCQIVATRVQQLIRILPAKIRPYGGKWCTRCRPLCLRVRPCLCPGRAWFHHIIQRWVGGIPALPARLPFHQATNEPVKYGPPIFKPLPYTHTNGNGQKVVLPKRQAMIIGVQLGQPDRRPVACKTRNPFV